MEHWNSGDAFGEVKEFDISEAAADIDGTPVHSEIAGNIWKILVKEGDAVKKGDTLLIVEAMKMFNEIEADKAGTIKEILVDNEHPVEYGQALFVIV